MISARLVDTTFIALVVIAMSITAVTLAKIAADSFNTYSSAMQSSGTEKPELKMTVQDSNTSSDVDGDSVTTSQLGLQYADPIPFDHPLAGYIYDFSPIVLPITWGAVAGIIIVDRMALG